MQTQSYEQRGISTAAECALMITRAEAETGTRRTIRFYGADGRECAVALDVPPGVTTGTRLPVALPGSGGAGYLAYGELVALVTVLPHARSECRGADVYVTVLSDRPSAERDGEVRVPLGDGRVLAVPVRAGITQERFVYAGQGLPRSYEPPRRGDLILRLELVDVPSVPDESRQPRHQVPHQWRRSLFRS